MLYVAARLGESSGGSQPQKSTGQAPFSLTGSPVVGSRYVWGSRGEGGRYETQGLTPDPSPQTPASSSSRYKKRPGSVGQISGKAFISSRSGSPLDRGRSGHRLDRGRRRPGLCRRPRTPFPGTTCYQCTTCFSRGVCRVPQRPAPEGRPQEVYLSKICLSFSPTGSGARKYAPENQPG